MLKRMLVILALDSLGVVKLEGVLFKKSHHPMISMIAPAGDFSYFKKLFT